MTSAHLGQVLTPLPVLIPMIAADSQAVRR